jgi:hypothetical protein
MLGRPLLDCFRNFYADTALGGRPHRNRVRARILRCRPCAVRVGCPFGAEGGASSIRETMKVLALLDIPTVDQEKLCYRDAETLFGLSTGC